MTTCCSTCDRSSPVIWSHRGQIHRGHTLSRRQVCMVYWNALTFVICVSFGISALKKDGYAPPYQTESKTLGFSPSRERRLQGRLRRIFINTLPRHSLQYCPHRANLSTTDSHKISTSRNQSAQYLLHVTNGWSIYWLLSLKLPDGKCRIYTSAVLTEFLRNKRFRGNLSAKVANTICTPKYPV